MMQGLTESTAHTVGEILLSRTLCVDANPRFGIWACKQDNLVLNGAPEVVMMHHEDS